MTLQDLGSLGELIGSIATVATLAYLALQIRQSNRGARVSSYYETASNITAVGLAVAQSEEMSRIWAGGMAEPERLSAAERERFELLMVVYFHQNQAEYLAHVHGFGEPDVWLAKLRELRLFLAQPGVRGAWERYRSMLGDDFRRFVDGLGDSGPPP